MFDVVLTGGLSHNFQVKYHSYVHCSARHHVTMWPPKQSFMVVRAAHSHFAALSCWPQQAFWPLNLCCCGSGVCREVLQGCFPGLTLLLCVVESEAQDSDLLQRYVLQAAADAADLPASEQLLLQEVPSVEHACLLGKPVTKRYQRGGTG